eukprot:gene5719-9539_t
MLEVEEVLIKIEKDTSNPDNIKLLGDLLREDHHRANTMKCRGVEILSKAFYDSIESKNTTCRSLVTRCYANLSYMAQDNIDQILKDEKIIDLVIESVQQDDNYELKRNAIAAISNFAHKEDEIRKTITKKQGFEILLKELLEKKENNDIPVFPHLLKGVENLLPCEETMNHFISIKGIDKLIELINIGDEDITNSIIPILGSFAALKDVNEETSKIFKLYQKLIEKDEYLESILEGLDSFVFVGGDFIKEIFELGFFKKIISSMKDHKIVSEGLKLITKVSEKEVYLKEFIELGILEVLKDLSISNDLEIQKAACKLLALLSLNDENIKILINEIDLISKLLKHQDLEILRFIAILAGNLARSDENCEKLIKEGISKQLLSLINTPELDIQVVGNCAFAFTNLIKLKTQRKELISQGSVKSLHSLLIHRSDLLEFYILDGLSNLSIDNKEVANEIIELGTEKVIEILIKNDKPRIKFCACKLLNSIYENDNKHKEQIILSDEAKETVKKLEEHEDKKISEMAKKTEEYYF